MSGSNGKPKFDGQKVVLGGVEYILPYLSLKQAKTLWPSILNLNQGVTAEDLPKKWDDVVPIIHAALSRNYPDLNIDELWELVDMSNYRRLLLIVAAQSGTDSPGLEPAAETSASIGPGSTAQSSREPAGTTASATTSA